MSPAPPVSLTALQHPRHVTPIIGSIGPMTAQAHQAKHASLWQEDAVSQDFPTLEGDRSFDVIVVGGGITGMTTATCSTTSSTEW